jgi:transposase-like protein
VERRKRYSRKFQRAAVERMKSCESVDELAKELGVTRRCLYKWRTKLEAVERTIPIEGFNMRARNTWRPWIGTA